MNPSDEAIKCITGCCPSIGAFSNLEHPELDVHLLLRHAASDMAKARDSRLFPGRYREHVAYAMMMVASSDFTSPPAAIGSLYLATRFEFYFRELSGVLEPDGSWKTAEAQASVRKVISDDHRIGKRRVSSLSLAYRIMKLDKSRLFVQHCDVLDSALFPEPMHAVGGVALDNLGDRIQYSRDAASHGNRGDISSEALFYGLLTTLVFYNQDRG